MPLFLKEKKSLIVLTVLIFFHLVLISLQVPLGEEESYLKKTIFSIFSPIQHGFVFFFQKIGRLWSGYFYLRNVESQNQRLKEEMFFLRQENNLLKNALRDFRNEKEIRNNLLKIYENILVARLIGLDASKFYKSIVINKGALDDIKKDMVVLDKYGNLVGRVISPVTLKEARVQLITDSESGVSVFSRNRKVVGVLSGDGKGKCRLKYILPTNKDVSEGIGLITSGFDGIFPSGINVGEVISITPTPTLFQEIRVKPYFDFGKLDQIAVLKTELKEIF